MAIAADKILSTLEDERTLPNPSATDGFIKNLPETLSL